MGAESAALPSTPAFLAIGGAILLVLCGGLFPARRTRPFLAAARFVEGLLGTLVAVILLGMVFLSGLQIILRNFFDSGLLWIDPLLRHLVLLLALTGALLATGLKRHVQINVLGRILRGGARKAGGAITALLAAGISLALAHAALVFFREERAFGEILFLSVPSWVVVGAIPLAFVTMAWRFVWVALLEVAGEAPADGEDAIATGDRGLSDGFPALRREDPS